MMDVLQSFFIDPILNRAGYNPINTLVYLLILLAVAFGIVYPQLRKRGVHFDGAFGLALLGFIAWGSSLRILEDAHVLARSASPLELGFYFITPGIWILVGLTTIAALLLSRVIAEKVNQKENHVLAVIGWLLALPFLAWNVLNLQNLEGLIWIIGLWGLFFALVIAFMHFSKNYWFLQDRLSQLAYAAQSLDGFATFVAIQGFGFSEQHVVSAGVLSLHPFLFPVIKACLVLVILRMLHEEKLDPQLKGFIKVLLLVLGMAPGLRNVLLLGVLGDGPMQSLW